jgi:hypothetical protein
MGTAPRIGVKPARASPAASARSGGFRARDWLAGASPPEMITAKHLVRYVSGKGTAPHVTSGARLERDLAGSCGLRAYHRRSRLTHCKEPLRFLDLWSLRAWLEADEGWNEQLAHDLIPTGRLIELCK